MPCNDGMGSGGRTEYVNVDNPVLAAALCGILSANPNILDKVDWAEAGITRRQIETWWKDHQAKDAARRLRENQAKRVARIKQDALKKLSAEEREALGLRFK